ncbi:hypothetical protein COLO4_34469 [Corchorus olitorius]|uniref:Uncharacterized protein n=1 Tax=Corchorus olitorius TaxID=93759 RepID=A0A1R3GKP3_9ROSI|nr:hypothetical protein COLO4_34469 [Corchorus olitorius]
MAKQMAADVSLRSRELGALPKVHRLAAILYL